jgi:prevent-host-death family protein
MNAGRVLARVEEEEPAEATSHGRLVARIVPVADGAALARLIAQGKAAPADDGDPLHIPPAETIAGAPLPSEVLAAMHADER